MKARHARRAFISLAEARKPMQTSAFEIYVLGLLAVLERMPVPIAIAFDGSASVSKATGRFAG